MTLKALRAFVTDWMRDRFLPVAAAILAMMAALTVPVLAMVLVFGGSKSYSVSTFPGRLMVVALTFGPALIWVILTVKRYYAQPPTLKYAGILGMQAGLAMFLALVTFLAFETANGYFDAGAERISVPILDVTELGLTSTRRTYLLVIEDRHKPGQETQLFWGRRYPDGWKANGNCLIATVGPGAFGLRWIADKQIAPCVEH